MASCPHDLVLMGLIGAGCFDQVQLGYAKGLWMCMYCFARGEGGCACPKHLQSFWYSPKHVAAVRRWVDMRWGDQ